MALFDGCVAAWKLDDLVDATGHNNTLTNHSCTFNTGKIGDAAYFDTRGDYLSAAHSTYLTFGDIDFTFAGWFYLDAAAFPNTICAKDHSSARGPNLQYRGGASAVQFTVFKPTNTAVSVFGPNASAGAWHLLIGWHDAAADTIYIQLDNGTVFSQATGGALQATGSVEFTIGRTQADGDDFGPGRVDAVHVWDRVLSSDERTELWNSGAGVEFIGGGLPTARAGLDQVRMELELVMLDGSQSTDPVLITSYLWEQVSGTAVTINNPTSINPTFTAPDVASPSDLVFRLTVEDADTNSDQEEVTITIVPTGSTTWLWHVPKEEGLDPDEFYDALALLPEPSMVIRNGRVLGTRGDVTLEGYIWSASKALVALIFARQLQLGNVAYTDTVPGSDNPTSPLATFEQFLSMVSDFGLNPHDPGNQYAYNNAAVHHYGTHLKTTFYAGNDHIQTLQNAYVTALDFEDTLTYNTSGFMSGWDGGWSMSCRDLARIAQLVLDRGEWESTQILADAFFDEIYSAQVPAGATENPDRDDLFYNEIPFSSDLPDAYTFGFWLSQHVTQVTTASQNEASVMYGAFGTSVYISRAKNLIVIGCNVGGTTTNNSSVIIPGWKFDLFANALPEQRASSRLTRASLFQFFDDDWTNRTEFQTAVPDIPLVPANGSHAHSAANLSLTQTHLLTVANSTHTHTATNILLEFALNGSWRLRRGLLFNFYDDEELNRTDFWEAPTDFTLSIQSATHAHSAQSLALTQVHDLTIQNSSHAHAAANTVLTQIHSLAVQNATHGHTAGSLTLTQVHALAVQGTDHAQSADNVTITQVHGLVVANASHSQTAQNLSLTQAHLLTIANSTHDQTADNLALTISTSLVVQPASHGHTAESLVLTGTHVLAVANSTHSHSADSVDLTQAHALTVQDAAHAHSAQSLTITQVHELVPASTSHQQSAESLTLTQTHVLAVGDAHHANTAENVELGTPGTLGIQSATHQHASQNLTLTQAHTLVIASTTHGQSADSLSITEVSNLNIQPAVHSHTADSFALDQVHVLTVSNSAHGHIAQSLTLGTLNDLEISNSFHSHTARRLLFSWAIPADVFVVPGQNVFSVPSRDVFVVAEEDRIFEV